MKKNISLSVHNFDSPDIEIDSWEPKTQEVKFLLEFEIGEVGDDRRDLFQVVVATPEGLRKYATGSVISDRATIVIVSSRIHIV